MTSLSIAPIWLWFAFVAGVAVLLIVDLSLFKNHRGKSNIRFSLIESACWIFASLAFNLWLGHHWGTDAGVQFLTGYLIEKSLSADNLFVIFLVFSAFHVPSRLQHRVLFFGVLGAIVMRGLFIIVGARLLHTFHWILYLFGVVLIIAACKFIAESLAKEDHDTRESWAIRFIRRLIPVSKHLESDHFFAIEAGRLVATPLLLALIVIEVTDLVFAIDSIPAVFSVTSDAFIAFASNILAVLGLRALYFVLAESVSKIRFLKPALAGVLGFIGLKMLTADFVQISSLASLGVIASILTVAGAASVLVERRA